FAKTAASGRAEAPVLAKLRAAGWGSGGADRVGRPGGASERGGPASVRGGRRADRRPHLPFGESQVYRVTEVDLVGRPEHRAVRAQGDRVPPGQGGRG